ncbi:mechanosensitive ion channel family protein [Qipengyuania gaetbuli]|uniref:mechanosensitive ion channel family protein n=1 Tax=Qipengyuania gaetbuli TaxID=266952 RepID=UPI001CFCD366|nr:mechanosensitive ion channel domain-containing protein [Qipengyuania gaetbuli]
MRKLIWAILFVFAASALGTPALLAQDDPPAAQEPAAPSTPARDIEDISAEQIEADPVGIATEILSTPPGEYSLSRLAKLRQLRAALGERREEAREIADAGTLDSRIIEAQIETLGPAPAEGETEPAATSKRREILYQRLSEELAPLLVLREHQVRAATLITEIDERISSIQEDRLLNYNGTPINPAIWVSALGATGSTLGEYLGKPSMGMLAIALVLMFILPTGILWLGKRWMAAVRARARNTSSSARSLVILLMNDIAGLIVALFIAGSIACGLAALLWGAVSQEMLLQVSVMALVGIKMVAIARWLGRSVFRSPIESLRIVHLSDADARQASRLTGLIGVTVGLEAWLEVVENDGIVVLAVSNLLSALLVLWGSWLVFRLARVIARRERKPPEPDPLADQTSTEVEVHEAIDFAGPLSRVVRVVALVAAAAAVVGFVYLAREIFFDIVGTLAVIAIAYLIQRTLRLILVVLAEGPLRRFRGIIHVLPVFTGFLIALASVPLLAMIWGYNGQEIVDGIIALRNGVSLGDITISAGDVFAFALVFFLGFVVTRWLQRILRLSILPQFALDLGARSAIVTIVGYVGVVLAALIAITSTGLDLSSLAFVAGALSVGLGFGLQSVVENFVSGIILLLERPVREGDWVEVGPYSGIVRKISVRSTRIETFDNHQIIVPNSQLITETVKNLSFAGDAARIIVPIGVAYDTDLDQARNALLEVAAANMLVLDDPAPAVAVEDFGDNSINLKLLAFVRDVTTGAGVKSDLSFAVAKRFAQDGIEIPFPQRVVTLRDERAAPAAG